MYSKVMSCALFGVEGVLLQIEADVRNGLPGISMVGSLSTEVREAKERVITAIHNAGYQIAPKRITINFSPADIRKEGSAFDLPIAIAILSSYGYFPQEELKTICFFGELSLNGEILPVNGILPMVCCAKEQGIKTCILPEGNELEGAIVQGICIVKAATLKQVVELLKNPEKQEQYKMERKDLFHREKEKKGMDFQDVIGQEFVKRAAEIAAAGHHNLLLLGPPGTGKSMIASRIPSIMPILTLEESIEVTKIYSVKGELKEGQALILKRPFRAPHPSITEAALIGGGRYPLPGEISMAHQGVLFLDELPEFSRSSLEALRQPLEEKKTRINRMQGNLVYPANILLLAAMNPCPCGYYPDPEKCHCTPLQIRRYLGKISHPLLERIDLMAEVVQVPFEKLQMVKKGETSAQIQYRVERAAKIQRKRLNGTGFYFNNQLSGQVLEEVCQLEKQEQKKIKQVFQKQGWSARTYYRVLKVARTIADLAESKQIKGEHLAEAMAYRGMEQKYWG